MFQFLLLLVITIKCTLQESPIPLVKTPLGKIEGYYTTSVNGRKYAAFDGVPYAQPPVGNYRFKEPQTITPWLGVWQAKTLHKCLQYNHYTEPGEDFVIGQEDCLYLNIYSPNLNQTALLDVIIFIHGGAFMFNAGHVYGPKIIMDRDVVFVNLNYRLGPLGFLSTEDQELPGNNGLRDQILALKWIKENIEYFGGNPNSVTLTGMSAGGASVQIHYLSPLSKGLFSRGISQSGNALDPWVLVENSLQKAQKLSEIVGCPTADSKQIVGCLRTRPGRQIVDAVRYFQPWLYNPFSPFAVVVDKWSSNPVLPDHPYILLKNGKSQDLPWIASNVQAEGLYPGADFYADKYLEDIDKRWNELIPFILDFNNTVDPALTNQISEKIRETYLKDNVVSKATYLTLIQIVSDRMFISNMMKSIRLQAEAMISPVHYYFYSYRGAHSKSELRSHSQENFGAAHGDDTVHILSSNVDTQGTEEDKKMSKILLDLWISFAKDGTPKLPKDLEWPQVSKNKSEPVNYLQIISPDNLNITAVENLGNSEFWNSLPLQESEKLFVES